LTLWIRARTLTLISGFSSAAGTVQKAVSGNFIFGVAMTAAQEAGELVQIQITKSGYQK